MSYQDIDIEALAKQHRWVALGMESVEDNYREHQASIKEHGRDSANRDNVISRAAWRGAMETLVRQLAELTGETLNETDTAVKGYIYHLFGWPHAPKGLEAWRNQ